MQEIERKQEGLEEEEEEEVEEEEEEEEEEEDFFWLFKWKLYLQLNQVSNILQNKRFMIRTLIRIIMERDWSIRYWQTWDR